MPFPKLMKIGPRGRKGPPILPKNVFPTLFPVQYSGLRVYYQAAVKELCLVAEGDAAIGMGGVPKISKGGVDYALYLVDVNDPHASPVRIQTSTGIKAVRKKT